MHRSITIGNKLCYDKDLKRAWLIHECKLKKLKSTVDTGRKLHTPTMPKPGKKEALKENRIKVIDRENSILLDRINAINCKASELSPEKRRQAEYSTRTTLHEPFRKRSNQKIAEENYSIYKRLTHKKSLYDVKEMEKDRKEVQNRINLISQFRYKAMKKSKTQVKLWMTNESFMNKDLQGYAFINCKGRTYKIISTVKNQKVQFESICQKTNQKIYLTLPASIIRRILRIKFNNYLENLLKSIKVNRFEKTLDLVDYSSGASLTRMFKQQDQFANKSQKGLSLDIKQKKADSSFMDWKLQIQGLQRDSQCRLNPYQVDGFKTYQRTISLAKS